MTYSLVGDGVYAVVGGAEEALVWGSLMCPSTLKAYSEYR